MQNKRETSSVRSGGPELRVEIASRTDVGKVRSENQDFCLVAAGDEGPGGGALMVVADGMGGHRGGATASRIAATEVRDQLSSSSMDDPSGALAAAIVKANLSVFEHAQGNSELRGMGTTVSVLYIRDGRAWFSHVGDSRIYRLREGTLDQLTQDHSVVASMVREGLLTDEEAAVHPRRNVLQRSLGVTPEVELDSGSGLEIAEGDTYLLCSDGLHGFVSADAIRESLGLDPEQAVERCIELAYAAGAPDNVTVVVCRVLGAPAPQPPGASVPWLWLLIALGAAGILIWLLARNGGY